MCGHRGDDLVLVLTFDHKASYEPRDYHKIYYLYRKDVPEKLINVKYVKMFGDTIQGHIPKEQIDWEEKIRKYRYTGGYANFHLMRFSKGLYIDQFPVWGQYKDAPADDDLYNYFINECGNDRYGQHTNKFVKQRPYTLFALQMTARKDFKETVKYIAWATQSKTYTIFKTHPCAGGGTDYKGLWSYCKKQGLLSEYTQLADGYHSEELVNNCDRFVSVDSGLTFKALLRDKPTCTLRGPSMTTDIVPLVETDDSILDVKAVDKKQKLKWLNWFYNRVCLDYHKDDYAEKTLEKLYKYEKKGLTDYEVHKW